jgi:hypothetical protein
VVVRRTEIWTDDLDGTSAAETVTFGLDDASYEIDLAKKNADALRQIFEPYVKAGTRYGKAGRPTRPMRAVDARLWQDAQRAHRQAVRAWARSEGQAISANGSISRQTEDLYREHMARAATNPVPKQPAGDVPAVTFSGTP